MTNTHFPTVHLNGTSAKELTNQAIKAGHALREAYEACSDAAPNARDYYVNPGSMGAAQATHVAIMTALSDAIQHYQDIIEHVENSTRR